MKISTQSVLCLFRIPRVRLHSMLGEWLLDVGNCGVLAGSKKHQALNEFNEVKFWAHQETGEQSTSLFVCLSTSINLKDSHRAKNIKQLLLLCYLHISWAWEHLQFVCPNVQNARPHPLWGHCLTLMAVLNFWVAHAVIQNIYVGSSPRTCWFNWREIFWTSEDSLFIDEVCLQDWYPDF